MNLKEIEKKVVELIPPECNLERVEAEGLDIVLYLKNIGRFYEEDQLIKKIAGVVRKKVLIRSDSSMLTEPEKAKRIIEELVPKEAGVSSIVFDPVFSEVNIEALKPGLVIGKGGAMLKEIIQKTGWAPQILRMPTISSSTISGIRKSMLKEATARKKFLISLGKKICSDVPKSDWLKVTALGGYREVGRSCTLLQTTNSRILIDCGINPETSEPTKAYPYLNAMNLSPSQIDAVIVTHAHLDHTGFIPYLFAYGYDGPVFCTPPTRDLMVLLQMDYLDLMSKYSNYPVPYSVKDIQKQLAHTVTIDYGEVMDVTPEIKLTFYNAGHILGSAQAHLHIGQGLHNTIFSGDIKYGFTKLFDQANTVFPRAETFFLESTYGGRNDVTASRFEADKNLISEISSTLQERGKVLIPVFSVGRSQEIMLVLEEHFSNNTDFNFQVYLDGMILEASAIHTAYPQYLRHNLQRRILSNDSPFESEIFEIVKKERKEIAEGEPCVILAPSGMLSGGPAVEFLKLLADNPKNKLIFVGYQSALSLGRKLQRGLKEIPLNDGNGKTDTLQVNMQISTVEGYSGHSDRHQLLSFARNLRPTPERIFTLHGDENKADDLAGTLSRMMRIEARAPMNLDAIRLK
ncbi:MAG: beta-CASP ribonuclease aCPSF1 [Candidatus Anstonellales archaeon]